MNTVWILHIAPLLMLMMFGGIIQYFGLASPTQLNMLCMPLMFFFIYKQQKILLLWGVVLTFCPFFIWVIYIWIKNNSEFYAIFTYVYYISCTCLGLAYGYSLHESLKKDYFGSIFCTKLLMYFIFVQFPVLVLQNIFGDILGANASQPIDAEDMNYGTLYMQSDSTLAFILVLASYFFGSISFSRSFMMALILNSVVCVFLTNSKIFQGLQVIVIIVAFFCGRNVSQEIKWISFVVWNFLLVFILFNYTENFSNAVDELLFVVRDEIDSNFYDKYLYGDGHRLAILGDIYHEGINYLGGGLLSYYNPINKSWLFNSGFGLPYTSYYETGLVGMILILGAFIILFVKYLKFNFDTIVLFVAFSVFIAFNLGLSDLLAMTVLGFLFSWLNNFRFQGRA